ncbi:MAG TPA: dihydroorotase [Candidatus Acidoferrales bacterium]|nr:dihydroorotase [Candidatus Acidoferrales bacterium]
MTTLVIEDAKIIDGNRLTRAYIVIEDEKIKSVGSKPPSHATHRIDAHGKIVLPGLVDGHAHLHDPAFTNREDFTTGTMAAAAGGVTTVVEMILSTPVDTVDRVREKIEEGTRRSLIDFSLHAGMMNQKNLQNIPEIANLGVRSFKTFTCKPYYADDHTLMSLMRETSMNGCILNVHAEDEAIANENLAKLQAARRTDSMAFAKWKPNIAEARAVEKIVDFTKGIDARLHISHMSTEEGVAIVKKAKREHVRVTAETCPHYLTFTRKDMRKQGPYLKMNPSLKGPKDVRALWDGLRNGTVDIVTSEHAPGTREEKEIGRTDIWKAWGGVPAIETMLPVLLSEGVNKRRISLPTLQRVCCENPAKVFGVYPRKGVIQAGSDADLVIVDLKIKRKVRAEDLHFKVGWTPYEGRSLKGWPIVTIRRGQLLYDDGQVVGIPGGAKFLPMVF